MISQAFQEKRDFVVAKVTHREKNEVDMSLEQQSVKYQYFNVFSILKHLFRQKGS
jgi:hypothetical protein